MLSLDAASGLCSKQNTGQRMENGPDQRSTMSTRPTTASNPAGASKRSRLDRHASSNTLSALLEPFSSKHGGSIPAASRAGADISEQKTANQIGLLESWKYIPFLTHQATSLASAFVSHHVFGPPKKSWGIELTLFTTAIRESVQFSHLSSLSLVRKFLNLGQILPVPRDGVVTPITFHVKRRNLPGLLAEADAAEDGSREITGEWVVSKRIWRRMQQEHSTPHRSYTSSAHNQKDKVILYLHGGAYYTMSAATHRYITISVSKYTDCRVFAVNYRLAPECRWPGQIHDAVSAYLRLTQDLKIPSENIIFGGDSAGGGLCLATMMYLRDNGMPLPCGAILMSPWVDLTMSCDSWETNAPYDYLRMPSGDDHMNPIASLLGAANVKKLITNPYVSPLFGEFKGLPPMLIQCGDAECLRDEGTLLAHKASLAGVQVYHEIYEDCPHVFQALFFLDAAKKAFRSHRQFVRRALPNLKRASTMDITTVDQEVMSDAHAIKEDGQPETQSLPATPRQPHRGLDDERDSGSDAEEDESSDQYSPQMEGDESMNTQDSSILLDDMHEEDALRNAASHAVGQMLKLGSQISTSQHHDLDRVEEEQDADTEAAFQDKPRSRAASLTSSPSTSSYRQRALSSLSITPSSSVSTAQSLPSSASRPSHSRQSSSSSVYTVKPGLFRQTSRPRARANSHPDFQALLDSYESSPSQAQTVLMSSEADQSDDSDEQTPPAGSEGSRKSSYGF